MGFLFEAFATAFFGRLTAIVELALAGLLSLACDLAAGRFAEAAGGFARGLATRTFGAF